jgi:hypothetical protein
MKKRAIEGDIDPLQQFIEWYLMSHLQAIDENRVHVSDGRGSYTAVIPIPSRIIEKGRN